MKGFIRYLRAQCKRFLLAYPKILALMIIIALCIGAVAVTVFHANDESDAAAAIKVKVGIVGNLEDTYLDLAVFALQNVDSSNLYANMITMELDEAKEKLEKGEIIGYLVVPDGYVEAVINGEDKLLTYVISDTPATFVPQLMNDVLETVSMYVTRSQGGIYGYNDICRENGIPRDVYRPESTDLSFDYLNLILARESASEAEYIGEISGYDLQTYYVGAFFCLILLLWGQSAAPILIKKDNSLSRLLCVRKTGALSQVVGEYVPFFLIQMINVLLLFLALFAASELWGISVLPAKGLDGILLIFAKLIPVVVLLSAMQFLLYEISAGMISGVLMVLFSTVALSFASGFFFPLNSLPESVAAFSKYLPTGSAFEYALGVLTKKDTYEGILTLLLFAAGLVVLSCLVRHRKIKGGGR